MQFSVIITSVLLGLAAAAENYDVGVSLVVDSIFKDHLGSAAPVNLALTNALAVGLQRGIMRCELGQYQVHVWIRKFPSYICAPLEC